MCNKEFCGRWLESVGFVVLTVCVQGKVHFNVWYFSNGVTRRCNALVRMIMHLSKV